MRNFDADSNDWGNWEEWEMFSLGTPGKIGYAASNHSLNLGATELDKYLPEIITGLIVGLTTSLVWAVLAIAWEWGRHWWIERSLRQLLQPSGISFLIGNKLGITFKNPTSIPIVIRSVEVRGGSHGGSKLVLLMDERHSPTGSKADERGWVALPALTKALWSTPAQTVPAPNDAFRNLMRPLKSLSVVVEYPTIFGGTKVIEVSPDPVQSRDILGTFESFLDGKINLGSRPPQ